MADGTKHEFGGSWTQAKLIVLQKYLAAYTTALKNKPFKTAYIDAFAGTGRIDSKEDSQSGRQLELFDGEGPERREFLDGSAALALQTQPRFQSYIFIERSKKRCLELERLRSEHEDLANEIHVRCGDANDLLADLCNRNWKSHRAVLFLDPYGMQLKWTTIEAVAKTEAIDMWLLFPLGMGANRLLTNSGQMPDSWRRRLNSFFGDSQWEEAFYATHEKKDLFSSGTTRAKAVTEEGITEYMLEKLRRIFAGVAETPGKLRNSSNTTLYLLLFAAANKNGAKPALSIANHLLKELT